MNIFTGKPGSGKSYDVAVNEIPYLLSRGAIVHTNIRVFHEPILKYVYERFGVTCEESSLVYHKLGRDLWENLRDVCPRGTRQQPNAIFLDEAHKFANARDWNDRSANKRENFMFCTEHRHFFIDLNFITQDENNIDAQFRRLTWFYFRYRDLAKVRLPFAGNIYPLPHTMKITIDYDGKTKMGQEIIPRRPEGFLLYDSHQAGLDETWAPVSLRGNIKIDKSKRLRGMVERIGKWFLILGILICVLLSLW